MISCRNSKKWGCSAVVGTRRCLSAPRIFGAKNLSENNKKICGKKKSKIQFSTKCSKKIAESSAPRAWRLLVNLGIFLVSSTTSSEIEPKQFYVIANLERTKYSNGRGVK